MDRTKLLSPTPEGIDEAARLLRAGQLVAVPTETVYGLAADATNGRAVADIFAAKGRPMDNPLIVHIADLGDWAPLVQSIPDDAMRLAKAYWPGPLTIILPASPLVPPEVRGGLATVAVRFPADPVAQAVILHAGRPLAAPSANRSGAPSPTNAARVMEDMDGRIAAVLDGGECAVGVESTVIDLSRRPPRLLRPGGITPDMLRRVLGTIEIDPAVTHGLAKGAVAASPGMKYRHYAPKARVRLLKGPDEAYIRFVNAHAAPGVAALCFDGHLPHLTVPALSYGARDDDLAQAHRVFDALRRLDEMGAKTVYAACPRPTGVGLAVYNRMIRAAAFDIVNIMPVIGLTGPTGAGKSTVADEWHKAGLPVVDADRIAREVTAPGSPCLDALAEAFGADILRPDGTLDRALLAERAFSSPPQTALLEKITHPPIVARIRQALEDAADAGSPAAVLDAPTLFQAGADTLCSDIVAVLAPRDAMLGRIVARDGLELSAARRRLAAQPDDAFYARPGVSVLDNAGSEEELRRQARAWLAAAERRWSTA